MFLVSEPTTERNVTILPLAPEVCDLVGRAARLPHGFAFLEFGPVACVSTALGVPASSIEALRASIASPEERASLLEAYERAVELLRAGGAPPPLAAPPAGAPPRRGPEELIEEARRHELGLDFLLDGPLETVAVTFSIHPVVILGAREILARGDRTRPRGADEDQDP